MSWTTTPYCTLDDVKSIADRRSGVDDTLISSLIVKAQAAVDAELGFSFQTDGTVDTPAERTFHGNDAGQLLIKPCMSFSSVVVRAYVVTTDGSGALARSFTDTDITADCFLGPSSHLDEGRPGFLLERYTGDVFPYGRQNIVVQGVWGYATIPATIVRATARLAVHYLNQRDARYQDIAGNDQYGTLVFQQQIPADVCALIRRERGMPVRS